MKNNKLLILLILLLQVVCLTGFAQKCNQGQQNRVDNNGRLQADQNPSAISTTQSTQPVDPNEIIGLDGYNAPESTDTFRWVSATQTLAYTVYFENDPELAMAAASKVTINVPLHEKLNYAAFGVGK